MEHAESLPQQSPQTLPRQKKMKREKRRGRTIGRLFTTEVDPFSLVEWDKRIVEITNDRGEAIFSQHDVEAPQFWSQTAVNVVASKYFRGENGSRIRESSIRDLISRVSNTISEWGMKDGYFAKAEDAQAFHDELTHILLHQKASFNSPVWFNVGVEPRPQCSACFILSVDDSLDSLLDLQKTEGRLFKYGSGAGTNLSSIRSTKEKLKGGGTPSGPISFMKGYDAWAGIIKSGGKTRRAAKMQILNVNHPDILDFIACKSREEKKACALIEQGYDGGFAVEGGAYDSIAFQNANLSVRVTDEFMEAALQDKGYFTKAVSTGEQIEELRAKEVLMKIAEATHQCGDPGLQFDDEINDWHTCPNSGRINASNPCSEYMSLDNSACNLASLNLLRFFTEEGEFLLEEYLHCVDILITAQDILIDRSSYPTEAIGECARAFRQLGLGFANLGATLMSLGVGYDSPEGRNWAAHLTSLMCAQAYLTSANLAKARGVFDGYEMNKLEMLAVIEKHKKAASVLTNGSVPRTLLEKSDELWTQALSEGSQYGYRNSQTTVLAPTGTISFMMDCDTTGIEPDLALIKYKRLADGGFLKLVNQSVARALKKLSYSPEKIASILSYIDEHDTIEGAPELKQEHLAIFDCALKPSKGQRCVSYEGHLSMMGAVQPFLSGAISKTVNLPAETTVEEIYNVYAAAWRMGLKAVALYRDGSKQTQPLSGNVKVKEEGTQENVAPVRRRLEDERSAITHKFSVAGLEGYLTVGMFEDGTPGEIFLVVAKEGSMLSGMTDAFATSISMALQYGVPLKALIRKFSHMRFEPSGFTHHPDLPMAKSIVDYVFRWMALRFLSDEEREELGLRARKPEEEQPHVVAQVAKPVAMGTNGKKSGDELLLSTFQNSEDAPPCTNCGSSLMVRQAGCYVCLNCGSQGGCG